MKQLFTLLIFCLLLGCSTTKTSVANQVQTRDTSQFIDQTSSENSESMRSYWTPIEQDTAEAPVSVLKKNLSGCVKLVVVVNKSGDTEFYKVNKSYPEDLFVEASKDVLKKWKWVPGEKNPDRTPMLTTIQFDFWVDGSSNLSEAKKQCGTYE